MNDDEHLAVEVAQFVQHVHDITDLIAERMRSLPADEAEAMLDQELARLAKRAKQLETTIDTPGIASSVGYKVRCYPDASRRATKARLKIDQTLSRLRRQDRGRSTLGTSCRRGRRPSLGHPTGRDVERSR